MIIHRCESCEFNTLAGPYRVLLRFDPRRSAILLLGGDKTGKNRWYKTFVPQADRLFSSTSAAWVL